MNELMRKISLKENTTEILAIMSSIASFLFLYLLFFVKIPEGNEHLVDIMGGVKTYSLQSRLFENNFDLVSLQSQVSRKQS